MGISHDVCVELQGLSILYKCYTDLGSSFIQQKSTGLIVLMPFIVLLQLSQNNPQHLFYI